MGEADWWLCASCSSLNNLAARKCYSCGQRKSKHAVRASEYLGYRPVVSWDGKVKLENLTAEERVRVAPQASDMTSQLTPLREPVQRNTLAVAPRPPHPARITYRLVEAAPGAPRTLPPLYGRAASPAPPGAPRAGAAPEPLTVPVGPGPDATARPPGAPEAGGSPGPLTVAVGPGPDPAALPPGQQWPHWQELLDGPVPHAERLRTAASGDAASGTRTNVGSRSDGMTLRSAIRLARTGDAGEFIAWPEADRPPEEADETAGERPAPSAEGRPPE